MPGRDVGRIAEDGVVGFGAQGGAPVALAQFHIAQFQPVAVDLCDLQRVGRLVGGDDPPGRPLPGQCQGDGARARAQIRHAPRRCIEARQAQLHQQFGFRARNQHARGNHQRQRPEFTHPGQIGQRLTGARRATPLGISPRCSASMGRSGKAMSCARGSRASAASSTCASRGAMPTAVACASSAATRGSSECIAAALPLIPRCRCYLVHLNPPFLMETL